MTDLSEELKAMNLEIQQEQRDLKEDSAVLADRKKALKAKESEYLKLSLQHLQSQK